MDNTNVAIVMAAAVAALHNLNVIIAAAAATLNETIDAFDSMSDEEEEDLTQNPLRMPDEPTQPPAKRARRSRARPEYATSTWGAMLQNPKLQDPKSKEAREFMDQFRVPHEFLPSLVEIGLQWFPQLENDVAGRPTIPMELKRAHYRLEIGREALISTVNGIPPSDLPSENFNLPQKVAKLMAANVEVLGWLHLLGRGGCFNDVVQLSGMSVASVHLFFHKFCERFASELYSTWVKVPVGDDLEEAMKHYDSLGYPGAMGSMDSTHVPWGRCPVSSTSLYSGKEGHPCVVYETIADHNRRILACTKGYPGSHDIKTVSRFDPALTRIRSEEPYVSQEFQLYSKDGVLKTHKGVYLLVDPGYHGWRQLMCPMRYPGSEEMALWGKRLKSVRNDSKRAIDILTGRFRILKTAMPFQAQKEVDNVFFTCCILHNMLLKFDGLDLDGDLEAGVDWAGADGSTDKGTATLPEVIARGYSGVNHESTRYDSKFGDFREELVEHFVYLAKRKKLP